MDKCGDAYCDYCGTYCSHCGTEKTLSYAAKDLLNACRAVDAEARDANTNGDVIIPSHVFDLVSQALEKATSEESE